MVSKRLKRIVLEDYIKDRLAYHNFNTCKDVLCRTPFELVKTLGLGYQTVRTLQLQVSRACLPQTVSVLEMWKGSSESPRFLHTSLLPLDEVLHGGLPASTITEVAGPSGCGKTQFSMMMSVIATQPLSRGGLNGGVVYIDTESAFCAERFLELAQARYNEVSTSDDDLMELTSRVHIIKVATCAALLNRLENLEDFLISHDIKLIVIDSIASLIRKEFDSRTGKNMIARTNLLSRQAAILKKTAQDFSIPVLVTNQITTRYDSDTRVANEPGRSETSEGSYVTAALGNTWSHCVNTRLILQYMHGPYRQILVAKSPVAPFANFVYTIKAGGFSLEEGQGEHYEGTDPGLQKIRVRTSIPQDGFLY